jgi:hypothetical protein
MRKPMRIGAGKYVEILLGKNDDGRSKGTSADDSKSEDEKVAPRLYAHICRLPG